MKHDFENIPLRVCGYPVLEEETPYAAPTDWLVRGEIGTWKVIRHATHYAAYGAAPGQFLGRRQTVRGVFSLVERDMVAAAYRARDFQRKVLGCD